MRWNTQTDEIEHGSWFSGRIYEMRSDVSFDGQHMIYLAMGATGTTWSGVCRPPFLRTVVDWANAGTYDGGGVFQSPNRLEINTWHTKYEAQQAMSAVPPDFPYKYEELHNRNYSEDEGVLYPRFERDGFRRVGPLGKERRIKTGVYTVIWVVYHFESVILEGSSITDSLALLGVQRFDVGGSERVTVSFRSGEVLGVFPCGVAPDGAKFHPHDRDRPVCVEADISDSVDDLVDTKTRIQRQHVVYGGFQDRLFNPSLKKESVTREDKVDHLILLALAPKISKSRGPRQSG